ncbi:uncharacterized membrane protein YidH (DUF202 family) [Kitasatospora gansuensis]|uniref:Uncharacterized membrane protein YidH (DUF202 family) n=1 Tax=Kitasatospora gansuensis TaxID=258050 RepID=A0A7W7SDA0_9ACTN|nr:DUF202 domain-containing protein [Kitasatospora gansuensis]MBB4948349.1 uncharacterized membrane protein YidH (DUF202 family) [Kitasatospora gansuensis]
MNRDPGLQPERTLLAWGRTALVLTVNAALVLRTGLADRQPGLVTLGGLLALTACATYGYGLRRRRQLEPAEGPPGPVGPVPLRAMAGAVCLVAAAAGWCVLLGPQG